ncbi:1-phosphofructokinase family hexose kinase [Candidatus Acetothermia bacterium]|nr:1-phosphofructokinase family hexose kinase [Candidatus Acetothermia bacterium]
MILTVTPNPALDKVYWVDRLNTEIETPMTRATRSLGWAGGKGINISTFLAHMGLETVAMGFIAGHTGRVIENRVREAGITTNFVWTEGETRTNIAIIEKGREERPIAISELGPQVPEMALRQFLQSYTRLVRRARWVVLGGSLPPGVPSNFYRELLKIAHQHKIKTVVNAAGDALAEALKEQPYLVKPDTRERREICGEPVESDEQIIPVSRRLVSAMGVGAVVVSHRVTSDILITPQEIWDFEAHGVQLVNLVGSEDALLAGMVYQLEKGHSLLDAVEFGMAAGTASAESVEQVCCDPELVRKAREKIRRVRLA